MSRRGLSQLVTENSQRARFYEIRNSNNVALKRNGSFAAQDAAKIAGREDAKKMKNLRQPDRPDVGRILVGQNAEKATRY
jgi:hypothetical protein